jgi:hypothetical protein
MNTVDATNTPDWLIGRIVTPTNRHYASGIHDDATAQSAGFRGGTIAGSAHLDTFVPLALQLFGPTWFTGGSVSMKFAYATTDGEPTIASVHRTSITANGQHVAKVETPVGVLVASGSIGAPGSTGPSHLRSNPLAHDATRARILANVSVGDQIGPGTDVIDAADTADRNNTGLITEALDWYAGVSPWGGAIVPPSAVIDAANRVVSAELLPKLPPAVGMWSALEVQFIRGPVFSDCSYTVDGEIVAINDSPKTEVIWQDMTLSNADGPVASVRIQSRFVKSTSPLWDAG